MEKTGGEIWNFKIYRKILAYPVILYNNSVILRFYFQLIQKMQGKLQIYNSLSRKKEIFEPIHSPNVGLYVCGPTVYGDPHLGHARPAITFDVVFRYLTFLGYKVRYVRNITDVGHLENDADTGEDKIGKKARLEKLEPMEVVQYFKNRYHRFISALNVDDPSIEPQASGHIIEQQLMVKQILKNGFAYESNGSVYFDVEKYNREYHYGKLSGRKLEDLLSNTRELDGQGEKHNPFDFALWKKASPEHIMRWPSEWSDGFPGWHLECSVMSTKYLGEKFDIHGGGMDLLFPHHECEIAQNVGASGNESVKYWMHNNMITINGQKMGKSLGNFITLEEFFTGTHKLLEKPFSPMTIRFFILQAHYRSTIDFSNDALLAAEKGLSRLTDGLYSLDLIQPVKNSTIDTAKIEQDCFDALNDDFNTAILISVLFDAVRMINSAREGREHLTVDDINHLRKIFDVFLHEILGIKEEKKDDSELTGKLIEMLLEQRLQAKKNKDFALSDKIRNELSSLGVQVKDTKDGYEWKIG